MSQNISEQQKNEQLLDSALPSLVCIGVCCVLSLISNSLLTATLICQKSPIRNFSFNALNLAIAEWIAAFATFGMVVIRVEQSFSEANFAHGLPCQIFEIFMLFGLISVSCQSFCLALDRFMSICFALWYHNVCSDYSTRKKLCIINFSLWFLCAAITSIVGATGMNKAPYERCTEVLVLKIPFYMGLVGICATFSLASIVCYIIIILSRFKARPSIVILAIEMNKTNNKIWRSVTAFMFCQFSTWCVTVLSLSVAVHFNVKVIMKVEETFGPLLFLNGTLSLPLYVWFIKQMRRDFLFICNRLCNYVKVSPSYS